MTSHIVNAPALVEIISSNDYQEHLIHPEHVLAIRQRLLTKKDAARTASLFAILGDPTRLQVIHALYHAPTGELCVYDLAAGLGRDDTTISHQLRILRNQQLVSSRRLGRVVYYRLIDRQIRQLLELSMAHLQEQAAPELFSEVEKSEVSA